MEESGNKGLGSTMQSDTSLHDSALKWWDGCEANTLPFNEGLSLAPFSSLPILAPPRRSQSLFCLPFPPFPCAFLADWMKVAAVRGTQRPISSGLTVPSLRYMPVRDLICSLLLDVAGREKINSMAALIMDPLQKVSV